MVSTTDNSLQSARVTKEILARGGIRPEATIVADLLGIIGNDPIAYLKASGLAGAVCSPAASEVHGNNGTRLGVWNNDGSWKLPASNARTLLVLGPSEEVGYKRLMALCVKRINTLVFAGLPNFDDLRRTSVAAFICEYSLRRASAFVHRAREQFHAFLTNKLAWLRGPAARICKDDLSKSAKELLRDVSAVKLSAIEGRIVLVNNGLAPGGAERQFVNTALLLKKAGVDVHVLVLKSGDSYFDFYRSKLEEHVPIYNLYSFAASDTAPILGDSEFIASLDQSLKKHKQKVRQLPWMDVSCFISALSKLRPSVTHIWQDSTNISAGIAACKLGIPRIVLATRNMAPHRFAYYQPFMKPFYKALLEYPSVVLTNNSFAGAKDYESWLNLTDSSIPVILNGIELSISDREEDTRIFRAATGISPKSVVVGSIFRFWPEKDPELWVSVASRIAESVPGVQFLLVGEGPMQNAILDAAKQKQIAEMLIMPGYQKDPVPALLCMDVFLLTSKYEGTPNVLIEAQMAGIPAVATDAGGCRDIVDHARTGFVVAERDPDVIAGHVVDLLLDKDRRAMMSQSARTRALERFGLQQMLATTLATYGR